MIFEHLELFERWRSRCTATGALACEVAAAFLEIGFDRGERVP